MIQRKRISRSAEVKILVQSRRRCCICFGLHRDDTLKRGQIVHLDKNPNNNSPVNLAYLCLEHHDEFDGKTSLSKGITPREVKKYRDELYDHYNKWNFVSSRKNLLNFLADTIDLKVIANAAKKIACDISLYGEDYAYQALTWKEFESCDGDIYAPFLNILDHFASWGLLDYTMEEIEDENGIINIHIDIDHKPICVDIAKILKRE
jgi:hypothetical protein